MSHFTNTFIFYVLEIISVFFDVFDVKFVLDTRLVALASSLKLRWVRESNEQSAASKR